jgi:hypothetical protein
MILKFPDLATLRLALTSGAVPPAVSQTAAVAGFGDGEQLWVETTSSLSRPAQNELKKLGVQTCRTSGAGLATEVGSWLELLPLQPDPDPLVGLEQTPVLFDLPDGEQLARLATEMLRLGNDRQGFRWLEESGRGASAALVAGRQGLALLRVVGPPYYSLLRALDRRGKPGAPLAFLEQAPGVWVEVGYTHPLAERIKPPRGRLLLLRPPRQWIVLEDAPFRDVYEVLEFNLPDTASRWHDGALDTRLKVPLSLKPGGSSDNPELWVLRGDPVAELNRFVQNNDDQMLGRLAFAVGQKDGRTAIVVRVRQSRQPPPQLVLNAQGYRHHLKLPNLFLPVGMGLHPPLRRDKVRELFAEDVSQVTWLAPSPGGTFTPQSLPEDAFRPLTDWVDYVLDHDREALQAWVQASQFDFEPFVCTEDGQPKPKKPEAPERTRAPKGGKAGPRHAPDDDATVSFEEAPTEPEPERELDAFGSVEKQEPTELEKERRALEEQFLALEGGLDAPERRALWPKLARCNGALASAEDAGICWLNALWWEKAPPAAWAWSWFATEATTAQPRLETGRKTPRSWLARLTGDASRPRELAGEDLDLLLRMAEPTTSDVRALAAYLVWAAGRNPPPAALVERLQPIQRFLDTHERLLPVRGVWLAWSNLVRLSDGDVLALARARDRLLERLFHNGLRPEQDLPNFLRFAGEPTSQRFRAVRQWMTDLAELAQRWVRDNAGDQKPPMDAYVNLYFAFGLARLGEADAARGLLAQAQAALAGKDEAHAYLLEAYRYRILQALDGKQHGGPLPVELLDKIKGMQTLQNYIVDRLRRHSHILEPHQRIDPYRKWGAKISDLENQLAELADLTDRKEIAARVHRLLKATPKGSEAAETRARVLRAGLDAAPRVGEEFGREMLEQTLPAYDALPEPENTSALEDQARLLERALFVAGHFDRVEHIHPLVARFQRLLQTQRGTQAVQALDTLARECFRGLRKLGMRDEIDRLLGQMADLVLEGKDLSAVNPLALPALLLVAAEWYFFGRDAQAEPVLQAARAVLLKGDLPAKDQTKLACAYARTVGQAPVAVAQKRLEETFTSVKGVKDTYTTSSHFSVSQLDLIEAVVLAVVSDDFTLGTQARRWLDEDEFLVRRRIHGDVRTLKAQG